MESNKERKALWEEMDHQAQAKVRLSLQFTEDFDSYTPKHLSDADHHEIISPI